MRGRRLLRQLLPWARAEARKPEFEVKLGSALGETTAAYVREDNLDALMIYPAPKGGWHADVVLKHVPPGIPNVMGTRVEQPLRTRAEAEEAGKSLLIFMVKLCERAKSTGDPVFLLHGWAFTLSLKVFELALKAMPEGAGGPSGGYETKEQAIERIEDVLAELCPDGFDGEAFNGWSPIRKARLLGVLTVAALTGVYVYPPRHDASPSGHTETSEAQH